MAEERLSKKTIAGIRCQDVQTGLHGFQVNEFETITKVEVTAKHVGLVAVGFARDGKHASDLMCRRVEKTSRE